MAAIAQERCFSELETDNKEYYSYKFRQDRCEGVYRNQYSSSGLINFIGISYSTEWVDIDNVETLSVSLSSNTVNNNLTKFIEINSSPNSEIPYRLDTSELNFADGKEFSTSIIRRFGLSFDDLYAKGLFYLNNGKKVYTPICLSESIAECKYQEPVVTLFFYRSLSGFEIELYKVSDDERSILIATKTFETYIRRNSFKKISINELVEGRLVGGYYKLKLNLFNSGSTKYESYEVYFP